MRQSRMRRLLAASAIAALPQLGGAQPPRDSITTPRIAIERFTVEGNTLLTQQEIDRTLAPFSGPGKDFADIQQGEVKQHESAGETGVVVRLFPEQNYGFIEIPGSPDLYFTRNVVAGGGFDQIKPGMMVFVTRATTEGPMGPQASSVKLLEARRSPA